MTVLLKCLSLKKMSVYIKEGFIYKEIGTERERERCLLNFQLYSWVQGIVSKSGYIIGNNSFEVTRRKTGILLK